MATIGQLAKRHGLARSTLLHYDRIGLLTPGGRTPAGYRIYAPADEARLARIVTLREAGLSLERIKQVLAAQPAALEQALEERLTQLNREIGRLRGQQQVIARLLQSSGDKKNRVMTKEGWVALLRDAGMSEEDMWNWHALFEESAPEAHHDFLESLNIPLAEIKTIRAWSRQKGGQDSSSG